MVVARTRKILTLLIYCEITILDPQGARNGPQAFFAEASSIFQSSNVCISVLIPFGHFFEFGCIKNLVSLALLVYSKRAFLDTQAWGLVLKLFLLLLAVSSNRVMVVYRWWYLSSSSLNLAAFRIQFIWLVKTRKIMALLVYSEKAFLDPEGRELVLKLFFAVTSSIFHSGSVWIPVLIGFGQFFELIAFEVQYIWLVRGLESSWLHR